MYVSIPTRIQSRTEFSFVFGPSKNDKTGKETNGTRVDQMILEKMKLTPYDPYLQAELVRRITGSGQRRPSVSTVGGTQKNSKSRVNKGKRKAASNLGGKSPTKNIAVTMTWRPACAPL